MVRSFLCRNSGQTGMMRINNTACFIVLSFLCHSVSCRESDSAMPLRYERGNLKEFMSDGPDPNFWPVRGRRSDKYANSINPYDMIYLRGDLPYSRGERKSSEEETATGVFWAGRGRSNDPEDGNFWAHRGRSFEPWSPDPILGNRLIVEEPGWIWFGNGERQSDSNLIEGEGCSCSEFGKTKRDISRQKLCLLKRKANNLIRELPQSEQFWPVRGKRPTKALPMMFDDDQFWPVRGRRDETWQENLRDLKTFWPARGRRDEENIAKDKQQPLDALITI